MNLNQSNGPDKKIATMMLTDSVKMLCKNLLTFQKNIRVQGLLGITIDDEDIFLVQINENVENENSIAMSDTVVANPVKHATRAASSTNKSSSVDESLRLKQSHEAEIGRLEIKTMVDEIVQNPSVSLDRVDDADFQNSGSVTLSDQEGPNNDESNDIHDEIRPECEIVGQATKINSSSEIDQPMKSINLRKKLHRCTQCDYSSLDKSTLNRHTSIVHDQVKPYECSACDKKFSQNSNRTKHYRSVHCSKKSYSCEQCEYQCLKKSSLITHQKNIHKRKDFLCAKCGKKFSQRVDLVRHSRVHSKEKPFKCIECEKSFSLKSTLKTHKRVVHEKLKPYLCTECGKNFSRKVHLQDHMNALHSKEKCYTCTQCDKTFLWRGYLQKHIKRKH